MKTIAQLVAEFMNPANEQMRADILRNHETGLASHGMSPQQADILRTMISSDVLPEMISELGDSSFTGPPPAIDVADLKQMMADFDAKGREVFPGRTGFVAEAMLSAAAAYNAAGVHIFGVDPEVVHMGGPVSLVIRGNGYEHNVASGTLPLVQFVPGDEPEDSPDAVPGTAKSMSCDIDLNERILVEVTFPYKGKWRAMVKNAGDATWSGDAEGKNILRVMPA